MTAVRIVVLLVAILALVVSVWALVRTRRQADIMRRRVPTPVGWKLAPTDRELRAAKHYYREGSDGTQNADGP